jgi:hypothetical protein
LRGFNDEKLMARKEKKERRRKRKEYVAKDPPDTAQHVGLKVACGAVRRALSTGGVLGVLRSNPGF